MTENESKNQFSAETIEEAIELGLQTLGLSEEEADISILHEGNKGLFGIGSKEALVHIKAKPVEPKSTPPTESVKEQSQKDPSDAADKKSDVFDEVYDVVEITRDTVAELLEKMHVTANVEAAIQPVDEHSKRAAVGVDITGEDLSILIGRKAETLDALQYVTRLIVGKELGKSVIINLDVQGYRKRKEQRLRRIAQTVANQAIETGRRQYLEPMSAWDRRIIHMELRENPDVYTESVGEGYRRKVTINPKE